ASASNDGKLNVWQVSQSEAAGLNLTLLYTLNHGEWVSSFDFSPDGRHLAAGTFSSQVVIWDLIDPRFVGDFFEQTQNQVMSVAFSPDGSDLAAGTVQGEVHYWQNLTYHPD
ncbi:MAG TPA: hypothetical protein VJ768_08435, partial [Anaerolineales bacterium]|nr:hypothetical protein [Anaerolineales bacterium]